MYSKFGRTMYQIENLTQRDNKILTPLADTYHYNCFLRVPVVLLQDRLIQRTCSAIHEVSYRAISAELRCFETRLLLNLFPILVHLDFGFSSWAFWDIITIYHPTERTKGSYISCKNPWSHWSQPRGHQQRHYCTQVSTSGHVILQQKVGPQGIRKIVINAYYANEPTKNLYIFSLILLTDTLGDTSYTPLYPHKLLIL